MITALKRLSTALFLLLLTSCNQGLPDSSDIRALIEDPMTETGVAIGKGSLVIKDIREIDGTVFDVSGTKVYRLRYEITAEFPEDGRYFLPGENLQFPLECSVAGKRGEIRTEQCKVTFELRGNG
jgi:hypothetical protein